LSEFDVKDFMVVGRGGKPVRAGDLAELLFYRKDRVIDWKSPDIEKQFPPDAIFSLGKWVKGAELFKNDAR